MPKVLVDVNKLVVVTDDYSGYLAGKCLVCGACGWLDGKVGYSADAEDVMGNRLKHKRSCAVSPHALMKMMKE